MPTYTPWTWSTPHGRHYCYRIEDDGTYARDPLWAGPTAPIAQAALKERANPPADETADENVEAQSQIHISENKSPRQALAALPPDVQATIRGLDRRVIRADLDHNNAELLDYRKTPHHNTTL